MIITEKQKKRALKNRQKLIRTGIYKERAGVLEELRGRKRQLAEYLRENKPFDKNRLTYLISSLESELFKEEVNEGGLTYDDADVTVVTALYSITREKIWKRPLDLTGCSGDKMWISQYA